MNDTTADTPLRDRLEAVGQGHLWAHAQGLPPTQRDAFLEAVAAEPWEILRSALDEAEATKGVPVLRPPQALTLKRQMNEGGLRRQLAGQGRLLVRGGRVATLLLAGGQGTRLGLEGPKGCFVFGPEADRSLYRIHVERVVAASRGAKRPVPFIVLVSRATEEATREALADARKWGLEEDQLQIVCQRQLPTLDLDGRALLEAPGRLASAPDGHGGALGALKDAGVLDRLSDEGIDVLTTFQVDNPLSLPLDPVMLGWMLERRAQAVGKAVRREPGEKVGVFARNIQGKCLVVEYSEFPDGGMPEELKMGSIALHAFGLEWLRELLHGDLDLPLHCATKKVAYWTPEGIVRPEAPNATKFERFIFDVFPKADRVEVHEVMRAREFAPVKNRSGKDSPETARALVEAEVRRWHEEQGHPAPEAASLRPLEMPSEPGTVE